MPKPGSVKRSTDESDVHLQPAPESSLLLLGHIGLDVSRETPARQFYGYGLGLTQAATAGGGIAFGAGPTQFRLSPKSAESADDLLKTEGDAGFDYTKGRLELFENLRRTDPFFYEGKDAKLKEARLGTYAETTMWPGSIRLWCEDARVPYDSMNALKAMFPRDVQKDTFVPLVGEFGMVAKDPWERNTFEVEDCPPWLAPHWRALTSGGGGGHIQGQGYGKGGVLGVVEVVHDVRDQSVLDGVERFYTQVLHTATSPTDGQCLIHFGPAKGVHQTLKFAVRPNAGAAGGGSGVLCLYLRTAAQFAAAHKACSLLADVGPWDTVERAREFVVPGCLDPQSGQVALALRHVIRSPAHPECAVSRAHSSDKLGGA